ncbi:trypsin-like peptidase domain-containing protein [Luteimonas saliphila]|uniref:trypsin-like peptidase domain-containing protein n=1 Tax=Luteimonas saliphila TaxID=2804919 RepID=UPI00192D8BA7
MKHTLAALLVLLAGCGGCASIPTHTDLRSVNHRLTTASGICSGTAVGPDLLVTALHCGKVVQVSGVPVEVETVETGKRDFVLLRVKGLEFKRWARRGDLPRQGDRLRWWGNPVGETDVYREGYVARVDENAIVIAAQICKGDSGAGLFNERGEVVGVVSAMTADQHCQFALSFP